jgi:hypothetical protein
MPCQVNIYPKRFQLFWTTVIVTGTILGFKSFDGNTTANRRVNIGCSATAKAEIQLAH